MLCVGSVPQARREHKSQTSIEPVYYDLGDPPSMGNTQKTYDTRYTLHYY